MLLQCIGNFLIFGFDFVVATVGAAVVAAWPSVTPLSSNHIAAKPSCNSRDRRREGCYGMQEILRSLHCPKATADP